MAAQTMFGGIAVARAPAPTAAPVFHPQLLRRQSDATSVCGYVSGNASDPVTCNAGGYCGFNPDLAAFGCCTEILGSTSVGGCVYATTCYDASAYSASCGVSCQSNTLAAWCTVAEYPYCRKYVDNGFGGYDCFSQPGHIINFVETPTANDVPNSVTVTSSSFSRTTSSSSSGVTASQGGSAGGHSGNNLGGNPGVAATPFSQTQQSGSAAGTAATSSPSTTSPSAASTTRTDLARFLLPLALIALCM